MDQINESKGLQLFLNRTYKTSILSVVGSLSVAKMLAPAAVLSPFYFSFGGLALSIGGMVAFNKSPYYQIEDMIQNQKVFKYISLKLLL